MLPPEVARREPAGALFAGEDGLDVVRRLVAEARAPFLAMEVDVGQARAVEALCRERRVRRRRGGRGPRGHRRWWSRVPEEFEACTAAAVSRSSAPTRLRAGLAPEKRRGGGARVPAEGTPRDKPFAPMFFSLDTLPELGPRTRALAERLLPGPVTLLVPDRGETLGIRVPDIPALAGARGRAADVGQFTGGRDAGAWRTCLRRSARAPTSCSTPASCRHAVDVIDLRRFETGAGRRSRGRAARSAVEAVVAGLSSRRRCASPSSPPSPCPPSRRRCRPVPAGLRERQLPRWPRPGHCLRGRRHGSMSRPFRVVCSGGSSASCSAPSATAARGSWRSPPGPPGSCSAGRSPSRRPRRARPDGAGRRSRARRRDRHARARGARGRRRRRRVSRPHRRHRRVDPALLFDPPGPRGPYDLPDRRTSRGRPERRHRPLASRRRTAGRWSRPRAERARGPRCWSSAPRLLKGFWSPSAACACCAARRGRRRHDRRRVHRRRPRQARHRRARRHVAHADASRLRRRAQGGARRGARRRGSGRGVDEPPAPPHGARLFAWSGAARPRHAFARGRRAAHRGAAGGRWGLRRVDSATSVAGDAAAAARGLKGRAARRRRGAARSRKGWSGGGFDRPQSLRGG